MRVLLSGLVRILIDYRPALRRRTGVGEHVHQLVTALCERDAAAGDEIAIFSASWRDRLQPADLPGVARFDRRIPVRLLNTLWHRLEWPPIEQLTRSTFDVAHSPHPLLLPARHAAQILTIHDLDFLAHPERTTAEIRRDYGALVASHAGRADHILVVSRYTAGQVVARLGVPPDKITVCPNGRPAWAPRPRPPADGYILFVGTLEPRKNVAGLLRAYRSLVATAPATPPLVLAGHSAGLDPQVEAALADPLLAGRVRRLGYVQPDARPGVYAGARVLVLPSFDEGFGIPVVEAMTIGVPVVASNRGALPETVADAGLLVDPDDDGALAESMARMLEDRALIERSVARGFARAQTYSWQASARILRQAYQTAAEARRRR